MASATLTRTGPGRISLTRLRTVRSATWAKLGFAVLCLVALVGYFAFPTYPTYDSFYALLWGRDLLHLHLPDFKVYRGPTEHPLAIAFGMFCALFGEGGARLMVLGSIASFVAAVAGVYRLGRLCFGPVVGLLAALLLLSRFFDENLAAQGYLDISYVALIVWATALEVERPRRGTAVLLTLAAAGLLRPDAWVLSGVYFLWCAWPTGRRPRMRTRPSTAGEPAVRSPGPPGADDRASVAAVGEPRRTTGELGGTTGELGGTTGELGGTTGEPPVTTNGRRLLYLALAVIAPVVWLAADAVVTGNPLYSLHSTAGLAQELGRSQGIPIVLESIWTFSLRIDKVPVIIGALAGVGLAVWLAPRRAVVPLAVLAILVAVFVAEGVAGASVIDRYLLGAAALMLVFSAVAIGGWSMLEPGSRLRRAWMLAGAALVLYGAFAAATTLSLSSLRTTLAYHEEFHEGLAAALKSPAVSTELKRCPLLSLPNNKLIPDARWILDSVGQRDIVARSQARADVTKGSHALENRIRQGSVAVYPLGSAVFFEAIVDVGDDPRDQVPLAGFKRIYASRYYAVYANCRT